VQCVKKGQSEEIDIGLELFEGVSRRGHSHTYRAIADVCGCAPSMIQLIESVGKKRIYRKMLPIIKELGIDQTDFKRMLSGMFS